MICKTIRVAGLIILASFALSSAAWATCSNASVSGTYGFVDSGTDASGTPAGTLWRVKFDPYDGKFSGTATTNQNGVIATGPISGTYAIAANCTLTGTVTDHVHNTTHALFAVVTSTGGVQLVSAKTGTTNGGFLVAQNSPTCTNAGVEGHFVLAVKGDFVAGAPFMGPVVLIAELTLSANDYGDGEIKGRLAGSEDGTILAFADEPVSGTYSVESNCSGTIKITAKGQPELTFRFVVVDGGNEMLLIENDADTVVTGTLQR